MLILYLMTAILLTIIASYWIDYLYALPDAPLSFKDSINQRSKYRKILYAACMFCLIENLVAKPYPLIVYSIVAAFFLLIIIFTDFEQYVIFDKVSLPFAVIGLISLFHLNLNIVNHLVAAFFGGMFFLFLALISRGALGGGDIKLIATLGLWFGTEDLFSIITIGSIFAGISALVMLIVNRKSKQDYFAYGPYFCMTAIYLLLR